MKLFPGSLPYTHSEPQQADRRTPSRDGVCRRLVNGHAPAIQPLWRNNRHGWSCVSVAGPGDMAEAISQECNRPSRIGNEVNP